MCSRSGRLNQLSGSLQRQCTAEDLTEDKLRELCAKFVSDIRAGELLGRPEGCRMRCLPRNAAGRHREAGWSDNMYGVSKLAEIALTKALARKVGRKLGILINAACPGCALRMHARPWHGPSPVKPRSSYTTTDVTSQKGNKTPAEGADTPVWLATLPSTDDAPNGGCFGERCELEW